jgi:hypothetical protein
MADLSLIPEAAWREAERRAGVVRPLAEQGRWPHHLVQTAAAALGLSVAAASAASRIAAAYGVSYDAFLKHALGRTGRGARDLDRISDAELARLLAGRGVSVDRMREMNCASIQARMNGTRRRNGPLTEEGSAALNKLRVTLSRSAKRPQANATADAGRLARQNWQVYRA